MSNREAIEWLRKKAETTPMPGARKMYLAAVKAFEAQKDMVSRKTANAAICNACGKIDCDQADKCEKLQLSPANISETPNSSDTISRQKAKNAICNACGKIDCDEMDTCKKLDIPSEESKALGWKYHTYIPHNKYCPKCGKDSPYNKLWDFCPNCGADMRGEQDG